MSRQINLFSEAVVVIDGSKFTAVDPVRILNQAYAHRDRKQ
jgi:hypothetical protein